MVTLYNGSDLVNLFLFRRLTFRSAGTTLYPLPCTAQDLSRLCPVCLAVFAEISYQPCPIAVRIAHLSSIQLIPLDIDKAICEPVSKQSDLPQRSFESMSICKRHRWLEQEVQITIIQSSETTRKQFGTANSPQHIPSGRYL